MSVSYSGNIALICPDCGMKMVNLVPSGERYHCTDCDLRLVRENDAFKLVRYGDTVGCIAVEEVEAQVTWRMLELAPAV